ncbi:MAG: hypothetical protein OXT67_02300 [Zetaproteobacteria bacterium]|nr:hypothetical protein [Zetaproteobacteria bacterium]
MFAQRHKLHYSRWLLCLCLSWGNALPAHPLGDFFHQYGRKILIGVGTALGVTSAAAVAGTVYALNNVSLAISDNTSNSSGATSCTAPYQGISCDFCQQHSPGQMCWSSTRQLIDSSAFDSISERLETGENPCEPLIMLLELLLHSQVDPFQVIHYLPREVKVSHAQITSLLTTPRYAPLRQAYPGLIQALYNQLSSWLPPRFSLGK